MSTLQHGWSGPRLGALAVTIAAALAAVSWGVLGTTRARAASPPVSVFPIAGDKVADPTTQLAFRGMPASQLGAIKVTGSESGVHTGTVEGDSDGEGGSFLPVKKFTAGETVTVNTALNIVGGNAGTYSFTVQMPGHPVAARPLPTAPRTKNDVWNYVSRPDLKPAALTVDKQPTKATAPGSLFIAPQAGPVNNGPELLGPYGGLTWFDPVPKGSYVTDFRPQTFQGKPVLTWWQGNVNLSGIGHGDDEIYSNSYRPVATLKDANGVDADLHEFLLTPQGTAWRTAYSPVVLDASKIKHGSKHEIVFDSIAQEIDIKTGLVLYQWDSLDHVALGASYSPVARHTGVPWDYFHINSIQPQPDGNVLISGRNTSEVYDVSGTNGSINWTVGGKFSSFKMGSNTMFYFQHDARLHDGDILTLFDDAGQPFKEKQSRALTLKLDGQKNTATLVSQYLHTPALKAPAEGNDQLLANGDQLVSWGQAPFITEFNSKGQEVFDMHFDAFNATYRAYRSAWNGYPTTLPAVAANTSGGKTTVWASWNGATSLNEWRVLGGSSAKSLKTVGGGAKKSFETSFRLGGSYAYVEVQALDSHGKVLRTSKPIKGT
jgi:Arylsulfotransferase (ASST)